MLSMGRSVFIESAWGKASVNICGSYWLINIVLYINAVIFRVVGRAASRRGLGFGEPIPPWTGGENCKRMHLSTTSPSLG